MRYAVTDIGANTVRMNIYDVCGSRYERILTQTDTPGLLGYVNDNRMSEEGILKLLDTITTFEQFAKNVQCDSTSYFATSSLRGVENSSDVTRVIREHTGVDIDLIGGESEALLSFAGLKLSFSDIKSGIMIDMGGGSTELLGFVDGMAVRAVSRPFGSLSLYRENVAGILPEKNEIKAIKASVDRNMRDVCWLGNYGDTAYLVGGTARTAGRLRDLIFRGGASEPVCRMTADELKAVYDIVKRPDRDALAVMLRAAPDRLHTLIPGMIAVRRILSAAGISNIVISPTGIREGYLTQKLMNKN